ncbi:bacterial Ig-like domain-containing protein [Enterococcus faecalis]|uniref:bacterial Ig-like domain-containing protein n=1 Tax=Enterococcus faecalis TaxID=1351 RepID=UPI0030C7C526
MKKILCSMLILFLLLNYGIEAFAETIINENDSVTETDKNVENSSIEPEKDSQPIQPEKELSTSFYDYAYIELIPCTLYEGEEFHLSNIFVSATDNAGRHVDLSDSRLVWFGLPESSIPEVKTYEIVCMLVGKNSGIPIATAKTSLVVKKDKSSIETKDSTLYVGQKWEPKDNFVSATDEDGSNIPWEDSRITKNGASIDTSKPGTYKITYTYKGKVKNTDSSFTVTVKEDQTKAELKNTELYTGQKWDLSSVFKNIIDKNGNPVKAGSLEHVWIDGEKTQELDTSKAGTHKVQIAILNAKNQWLYSNVAVVTVKQASLFLNVKDLELFKGEKFLVRNMFVSAMENDREIPWGSSQINYEIPESIEKVGVHSINFYLSSKDGNRMTSKTAKLTVKEDKTSLEVNKGTHYIYKGEHWDPKRGLKKATDADGKEISIDKVEHWWGEGGAIDPNKIGDRRAYFYRVYRKNGSNIYNNVFVQVKEDKSSIKTKDSTLYVGQKWDPKDNFVSATDEDGKNIPWEDSRITKNGASIDTSKPGTYKITYTYKGKVKNTDSSFTVTVKEEPFLLKHVPDLAFGEKDLSSVDKLIVNKTENPTIELETPSTMGKDWQLQVELSPFLDKKSEKNILKGVSLFIPKGKLESDLEKEEPNQYECQLEANGKASILMSGTKIKGKGRWKNKLETKGITLSIPSENKTGNYESTLHWTLLDVPG